MKRRCLIMLCISLFIIASIIVLMIRSRSHNLYIMYMLNMALGNEQIENTRIPIPESVRIPKQLDSQEFADGPPSFAGATSIWQMGAVPCGQAYCPIFVFTRPPQEPYVTTPTTIIEMGRTLFASIVIGIDGMGMTRQQIDHFQKLWVAPYDIGKVMITSIEHSSTDYDNPKGIVHFTTTTGVTGRFDLERQIWTFDK